MTNRDAFVDMIRFSELGQALIEASDEGYNVLVGSTAQHPILFHGYETHPHVFNARFDSTAAGAFQIIWPTFVNLCKQKGYTDFGKDTQRAMAIDLIAGKDALASVDSGQFADAVFRCREVWASLPGGDSGQHEQHFNDLMAFYVTAGGTVSGE